MYLVYIKRNQEYADTMTIGRHRMRYRTQYKTTEFDITKHSIIEFSSYFEADTEEDANILAEHLAKSNPTKEVVIGKLCASWQSETPAVRKKTISEKGTLPA